jgi:hypothetical protein
VLLCADVDARSIEVNSRELRGKRYTRFDTLRMRRRCLLQVGVVLTAASPLRTRFISDTMGAEVRSLHSPKRDHVAAARVTTDVGAFLRNHANGRAQSTNDGSVSSTHCV